MTLSLDQPSASSAAVLRPAARSPDAATPPSYSLELFDAHTGLANPVARLVTRFEATASSDRWYALHDADPTTHLGTLSVFDASTGTFAPFVTNVSTAYYSNGEFVSGWKGETPFVAYLPERRVLTPCTSSAGYTLLDDGFACIEKTAPVLRVQARTAAQPTSFTYTSAPTGMQTPDNRHLRWNADGGLWAASLTSTSALAVCPEGGQVIATSTSGAFVAVCGTSEKRLVFADLEAQTVRPMIPNADGNVTISSCAVSSTGHAAACRYRLTYPASSWSCSSTSTSCVVVLGPSATDRILMPFDVSTSYDSLRAAFSRDDAAAAIASSAMRGVTTVFFGASSPRTSTYQIDNATPILLGAGGAHAAILSNGSSIYLVDSQTGAGRSFTGWNSWSQVSDAVILASDLLLDADAGTLVSGPQMDHPVIAGPAGKKVITWIDPATKDLKAWTGAQGFMTLVEDMGGTASSTQPSLVWAHASTRNATYGRVDRVTATFEPLASGLVPELIETGIGRSYALSEPDPQGAARVVFFRGSKAPETDAVELGARATPPFIYRLRDLDTYAFRGTLPGGASGIVIGKIGGSAFVAAPEADAFVFISDDRLRADLRGVRGVSSVPAGSILPLESLAHLPAAETLSPDGTLLLYGLADGAADGRHGFYRADVR